jgi:hypothetical protein
MSIILSLSVAGSLLGNQINIADSSKTKRFNKIEFSLGQQTGFYLNPQLNDFLQMHPQSLLLKEFDQNISSAAYSSSSFIAALSTHINLAKNKSPRRVKPYLRAGINYLSWSYYGISDSNESLINTDTLISPTSGSTLFVDTNMRSSRYASLTTQQVRLDVAMLFNINQHRRLSFTTGLGLLVGTSLSPRTEIRKYYSYNVDIYDQDQQFMYPANYQGPMPNPLSITEVFTSPSIFHFQLYAPLIFNYQFGSRTPDGFNSKYELQFEMSPGMAFENIRKTTSFSFSTIQSRISLIREF